MFCNGPRTGEGDIARLGPAAITEMTSLEVLFVLDHDCGRYKWFGWAHQLLVQNPFLKSRIQPMNQLNKVKIVVHKLLNFKQTSKKLNEKGKIY